MKNLILKDLKLSVHPTIAIYAAVAGGLMFVPAYPRSMALLYSIIGIFMIFQCDLQNHDRTFCCLLPVTKKQIVKSRVLSVILIQLGLMLISVPCAVAAHTILKNISNPAGMNANAIMYAIVLIGYAVSNRIMIPNGYRKNFKIVWSFFGSLAAYILISGTAELMIAVTAGDNGLLNGTASSDIMRQLPLLAVAVIFYGIMNVRTYKVAARNFERAEI